jgi:hypothetical protein
MGNASIVEKNHLALFGETIGHRWIPMVHGAGEMLIEDERHAAGFAESAMCEADSVGLYELCRPGLVGVLGH